MFPNHRQLSPQQHLLVPVPEFRCLGALVRDLAF
jgi:hypothetical protein